MTIFGPEVEGEKASLEATLAVFTEETEIQVEVEGTRDFDAEIGGRVAADDPPDIAMFPQPARLHAFEEDIPALSDEVVELARENFDPAFTERVTTPSGELEGVPIKTDLKSVVWYSPPVFRTNGYTVPETFEELLDLTDQMIADGNHPFCLGIESGESSGWPVTDWIEDWMLRMKGPERYRQWQEHEIPFDHPDAVEVGEAVLDLWRQEGFLFGGTTAAVGTSFAHAGLPVPEGECMMHRQANFYAANWPDGVNAGPGGQVDAFVLPGSEDHPNVLLTGGMYAAAFDDRRAVSRVMEFLATKDFAEARVEHASSEFLSPNRTIDIGLYPDALTRSFAEVLRDEEMDILFDASDLMPPTVGTGSFWTASVEMLVGSKDVATAFADVEANWPDDQ